jgi:CubicO group peptidase (beta-lactamase class C family)
MIPMRLLLSLALAALPAQSLLEKTTVQIDSANIQGAVLLAKNGKVILSKGYGLANAEHDVPNKPETKFRLGSITKQFTAAAILQLQEQGKLSVRDNVLKYIPSAPSAWNGITIHHLLTHTSGIPSYTGAPGYERLMRHPAGPPLDFVNRFKSLPLEFIPGEKFKYNNSGYFLLGIIIEQASGQSYENYLRTRIFDPLGMNDTGYDHPGTVLKNRAAGYNKSRNAEFLDMDQPYAAGSLYSTVLDLYKWDQALRSTAVLTRPSLQTAFTPGKLNWAPGIQYGYGWGTATVAGRQAVGHGGGINGFSTVIWRAVEQDAVVIILSNREDAPNIGKAGRDLLELLLEP